MKPTPRIVVAGTHSGVGKTTIAIAIMAAFARRGLRVQPFKIGPDFIDPSFHYAASGRVSRNLDGWMLSRETNLHLFASATTDVDIAIVEGVMGLFDGRDGASDAGSTAEMAKWLNAPVVLVVDASAMARSAAAVVRGFEEFDPALCMAGVLFNQVGGSGHAEMLREAIAKNCRSSVLGCLTANSKVALPSRHLGLTMAEESLTEACLSEMASWIEGCLDLDRLLRLAQEQATPIQSSPPSEPASVRAKVRIGVARDRAFCFYYQDNLDLLARFGAKLVPFSPIADRELPSDLGGLYLGGGYPELHAAQLAQSQSMLQSIHRFAESGAPIYAECGGFMYLTRAIVDGDGKEYPVAGVFPTRARMQPHLAALGYIQPETTPDALWARGCQNLRGHEFRYSIIDPMPAAVSRVYQEPAEGYRVQSVLGSYIHLHFLSSPDFARGFVEHCARYRAGS